MKDVTKIDVGKHTIKIVRLKEYDSKNKYAYITAEPCVAPGYGFFPPGDIQYCCTDKQKRADIYSAIAKWATAIKVDSIGGPILSGALLAEGVAARSRKLLPFYINKRKGFYKPTKHSVLQIKGKLNGKYIIIDDLVADGDTLETALRNIMYNQASLDDLKAVLILDGSFSINKKSRPKLTRLVNEGKVFTLYCGRRKSEQRKKRNG
jgi:orotate phosphoribosyltransferase